MELKFDWLFDVLNAVSILSRFMHCAGELHLRTGKRVIRYVKDTSDFGVKFLKIKEFKLVGFSDSGWGEFVAATATVNQALWLRKILSDLNLEQESTKILVDNQVVIAISHNPMFHGKTKHLNIKLFFLREVQKEANVMLIHCKTEKQIADVFTKPLQSADEQFVAVSHVLVSDINIGYEDIVNTQALAIIWKFDFSPFMVLTIAILNDGTIMTISKYRVKPSPKPDS
ncbi:hypothetical protein J1N35_025809 [Gossypium stocksii]|uniref:Uncharacterized protein n=1 Tax=Gossypium stocksii TaxID=47602 RepID=A0A9D3V713_9ROSI|nr:hypothetical protein J1N35_025809 [Gossypium stocksii]